MPAVATNGKILVTGASGFLGAWVVQKVLERGLSVRGTVRSTSKGTYLRDLFEKDFPGKFEFVIVQDIAAPGGFDDAVKDVDGIAHTASPVVFLEPGISPDVLFKPAVEGTLGVLRSAAQHGSKVTRVVVTSSGASLLEPHEGPYAYSERDWNEYSIKLVEKEGAAAEGVHKYRASKTLAEKALWKFIGEQKRFDAVSVLPPFIYGPIIHEVSSMDQLNLSSKQLCDIFVTELPEEKLGTYAGQFIDVRDVAEAHVDALTREDLAGRRLVIGNGAIAWQDLYDAANSLPATTFAGLPFKIPKGKPGASDQTRASFIRYSDESRLLLGSTFRPLPEVVRDSLLSLWERKLI